MIAQPENKALVTVTPDKQHTTHIEPFSERELFALDVAMHVQDEQHRNLLLTHASPGYVCHPNTEHELHETMYLAHHDVLAEVSPGWFSFTSLGIARAQATDHAS